MAYLLQSAHEIQNEKWDKSIREFEGGTIFHELEYLAYHKQKFTNQSHFIAIYKGEALFGLLAGVVDKGNEIHYRSPFGSSFGGPVFREPLSLKDAVELVDLLLTHLRSLRVDRITFTTPPNQYSLNNEVLGYCLLRAGFKIKKSDIFNILMIQATAQKVSETYQGRVRTILRKEESSYIISRNAPIDQFYKILLIDKREKGTVPTHGLEDLIYLKVKYPERVRIDMAVHRDTGAQFGVCYFQVTREGWMTFYMAQDRKELRLNGITILINSFLLEAAGKYKFLDFGGSTFGYEIENMGISNFKESFGSINQLRTTYEMEMTYE